MQLRSDELLNTAWVTRDSAYVIGPTKVGCSVLSEGSRIYSGCNVEHRYRSHDVHAEVNAITNMVAAGERRLLALAVVAERERFTPCGACLDWIFQFADPETCMVFCQAARNGPVTEYLLQDLMPFHPK
ncbi:cytidine deaminase family protein [Tunturiibacter gelidoferens]|uniref:cytidine deaminase family protein n=1 Tax=Tunturiibacter gelidiferens TaxID=3069689 RepID=UPI0015CB2F53